MPPLRLRSHAKLNWHLEVVRRRADGYHELRTLFQTIDLADELALEPIASGVELELEGAPAGLTAGPENLARRAADRYFARFGAAGRGVRMRLVKRIPLGGGLGGGSSNAAAVLAGMARLFDPAPDHDALLSLARELGADVPFFLFGGVALGSGRGDEIAPLADDAVNDVDLWLAVPDFAVPTQAVFAAHRVGPKQPLPEALSRALAGELPADLARLGGWNDLEPTCFSLFPQLGEVYNRLTVSGASWVRLSGSGGTICARFSDARDAEAAGNHLPPGFLWLPTRTLRRDDWRRSAGW